MKQHAAPAEPSAMKEGGPRAPQLLEAMIESSTSLMFLKDVDGRYVLVNRRFIEAFQLPREQVLGRTDYELLPRNVADAFRANDLEVMRAGVPVEFEEVAPYGDGLHTSIVEKFPWHREDGSLGGVGGIALDITARKRAEREQKELEAKMLQAQKLESLGVLAGGVAHDFNNLLAAILANAELASRALPESAPALELLEQIETAAVRAADLTKQMLAYAGRASIAVAPVELSALVEEMVSLLGSVISKKALVKLELGRDLPPVKADATQLRQVLMNLLTNASEALQSRTGSIHVSTGVIDATAAELRSPHLSEAPLPGRYVYVEVTDTGVGMSADTLARMFDPFFTTKFTGRGLGLAAVLGIVRSHGGALQVHSLPGAGTCFRVLLPATGDRAPVTVARTSSAWQGSGRVLIVDDEPAVRRALRAMLERAQFEVHEASEGAEALALLRERARELSLVLLDVTMPHMSGDELLRELRALEPTLPVVMMSGMGDVDVAAQLEGLSFNAFLHKPFRVEQLLRVARENLRVTAR